MRCSDLRPASVQLLTFLRSRRPTPSTRRRAAPTHPPTRSAHTLRHGQSPELDIPLGRARRGRLLARAVVHLRRQGRHARRHLRPPVRSQGDGRQRGHALLGPVAAARHRLRCPHTAAQHQHHDGLQGHADGHSHAEGPAPPGGQAAAEDLPEPRPRLRRACPALDRQRSAQVHRRAVRRRRAHHPTRGRLQQDPRRPAQARRRVQHCPRGRLHHTHDLRQGVHQGRRGEADRPAGGRARALRRREGGAGEAGQRHPRRGRSRGRRHNLQGRGQERRRSDHDPTNRDTEGHCADAGQKSQRLVPARWLGGV